ncbi:hypothetical protein MNV49_007471 [Pseudohyphozyma bogoriensis]|nr:hypothetical protein MNV49_007471 [Pseudohyphozyma bogoriensis]
MDPEPLTQAPASVSSLISSETPTQAIVVDAPLPAPFPPPAPSIYPTHGFATVHTLSQQKPHPEPYTSVPPYVPPAQTGPTPSGVVGDGRFRVVGEDGKGAGTDGWTGAVVKEDEAQRWTVAELKKKGLGRVPSGFCYSSRMTLHAPLQAEVDKGEPPHPEQPARIMGIWKAIDAAGLTSRMERVAVREAVKQEILLVHSEGHWERVRGTGFQTIPYLNTCAEYFDRLSLYVNPDSAICARLACGGVIEMCRAVAEGQVRNGFAIVRPPGHHAEPEDAMGFCFFNNVAVTARWLRTMYGGDDAETQANGSASTSGGEEKGKGKEKAGAAGLQVEKEKKIEKILILDWDVHHGNGTQKAFWDDPNVLFISLHRHGKDSDGHEFYPGGTYGSLEMCGEGAGEGFSVNIPFPHVGMTDADYIYAFQQVVMPIAYEFDPDFVIVSAGYDAADGDTLGKMKVSPAGFAHMTHMLSVLANGKLVLALEGGYNVAAVARSAHACIEVLVGDEPRHLKLNPASPSATNTCHDVKLFHKRYWKCMGEALENPNTLMDAGKVVPISEILKAHRTYELYHQFGLYNIEFAQEDLESTYKDQLLCSENVYDCETLVIFLHDLGSLKASFSAATLDVHVEKTMLIDTSSQVLNWALKENDFGIVDVNFLAHFTTTKDEVPDPARDKAMEKKLALYIWDNIASISSAKNIILFGSGCGASALMAIVQNRAQVKEKVKACVSVLGLEPPPELEASSGVRPWYKENSLVLLPATHPLHEDARKAGKHQKKYGNVHRMTAEDEGRPLHLLQASLAQIKKFVRKKLPKIVTKVDGDGDEEMSEA